ncbi:pyridoxamine 5'-phosphate oxidase family protein [Variovorax sp. J22P168]|uniref:MSMEG_1061 family FMN-dependent PPOX-type flavoprotein n=1 Tax=Variovorax jilinensis TaxID=3053513 RepID=UPI002575B35B|nr:MSMEG_1061 family FMN-dependent PPOX-type flavoprotein [Variovorax sp. J22P168]MDM0015517.1 pyridoxamine 5'-phosphate oxidase family protein [Variovorax sp. J22P168]
MISSLAQLRALYAAPGERAVRKQLDRLDVHDRRFVALAPFCVVASAGTDGALLDVSPRGGTPGFVKASEDGATLWLPDSGGNNRLDTLENLLVDPRISLIFMIPGVDETLRVNGTALLRDEPTFTHRFAQERQQPKLVIEVAVREAYLHCAKAFMRSQLWQADTAVSRNALPSMNQMIHDQIGAGPVTESAAETMARYRLQIEGEQGIRP